MNWIGGKEFASWPKSHCAWGHAVGGVGHAEVWLRRLESRTVERFWLEGEMLDPVGLGAGALLRLRGSSNLVQDQRERRMLFT